MRPLARPPLKDLLDQISLDSVASLVSPDKDCHHSLCKNLDTDQHWLLLCHAPDLIRYMSSSATQISRIGPNSHHSSS